MPCLTNKKYIRIVVLLIGLLSFLSPAFSQDTVSDYDGNSYKTVMIGDQIWMAENLKSEHDAAGEVIRRVCYKWNPENCQDFGGLYAWIHLKVNESGEGDMQGICPNDWHIPSDEEFAVLIDAVGGADSAALILQQADRVDFNMQYGGNYHSRLENFNYRDKIAYYWTSTNFSSTAAWMIMIGRNYVNSNRSTIPIVYGLSVRCVKD
jgi:uncharacterized protein (TIGR02145 family)